MKRIIDLTEGDIKRIVLRVIKEQDTDNKSGFETRLQSAFKATTDELKKFMDQLTGRSSGEEKSSDESSEVNVSAKGQELLNNPIFKKKLKEISDTINIDQNSIIKLMKHESGLNPKAKNQLGCVGLIQFCPGGGAPKTINGKSYSLEELRNDLEAQMDGIKEFWGKGYRNGKIKSPADLYIYNFLPAFAGQPDNKVLEYGSVSAEKLARQNKVFNRKLGRRDDHPLTIGDLKKYYKITGMV